MVKPGKQIIVRIEDRLASKFKAICALNKETQTQVIADFIKKYVEKHVNRSSFKERKNDSDSV